MLAIAFTNVNSIQSYYKVITFFETNKTNVSLQMMPSCLVSVKFRTEPREQYKAEPQRPLKLITLCRTFTKADSWS